MKMSFEVLFSLFIAFAISVLLGPFVIPFLRRLKVGQTEREEGVKSHLKKAGTPTMGGLMILISVLITSLLFVRSTPRIIPILFLTIGFGVIGFIDDYLKVVLRRSDGLFPKQKLLLQFVVTTIFVVYILVFDPDSLIILIPFTNGMYFNVRWVTVPLVYFVVLGTVNGVNFTDGLDGLASSVTAVVAVFFTVLSIATNAGIETITAAVAGALMGFLMFNSHPAKVFMGDTGSLALGGFVAGAAYVLQIPILIPIFGLIYLVEVISVMIQVTYFKKTGGKRFFKMAPIHHHFELSGWSETQIVTLFTVVTALLCAIALFSLS